MVLVTMDSGECIEVPEADAARKTLEHLICLDPMGVEIARFPLSSVVTFTADRQLAEAIVEEECDDVTVVDRKDDDEPSGRVETTPSE